MTRRLLALTLAGLVTVIAAARTAGSGAQTADTQPLRLSAANPHHLEDRGRPLLLISSAEHDGALINLDFDFVPRRSRLTWH